MLVIGSGASGLAAAVSAERAGARVAPRDEGLAPGEQLVEGAGRHPGRRSAADDSPEQPRGGRHALVARDRRSAPRRGAHLRGAGRRSTGSRSSASSSRARDGGYRLARCGGATAKRLLQVGDRTGHAITKQLRDAWEAGSGTSLIERAAPRRSQQVERPLARACRRPRGRGGRDRAGRRRPLLRRGRAQAASFRRTTRTRPAR